MVSIPITNRKLHQNDEGRIVDGSNTNALSPFNVNPCAQEISDFSSEIPSVFYVVPVPYASIDGSQRYLLFALYALNALMFHLFFFIEPLIFCKFKKFLKDSQEFFLFMQPLILRGIKSRGLIWRLLSLRNSMSRVFRIFGFLSKSELNRVNTNS